MRRVIGISIFFVGLVGCGAIRTDGYMSFDGQGIEMIYFDVKDRDGFVTRLTSDFGEYRMDQNNSLVWTSVKKLDWSDVTFKMQLTSTKEAKSDYYNLGIGIVTEKGDVLTSSKSDKLPLIKEYVRKVIKETQK